MKLLTAESSRHPRAVVDEVTGAEGEDGEAGEVGHVDDAGRLLGAGVDHRPRAPEDRRPPGPQRPDPQHDRDDEHRGADSSEQSSLGVGTVQAQQQPPQPTEHATGHRAGPGRDRERGDEDVVEGREHDEGAEDERERVHRLLVPGVAPGHAPSAARRAALGAVRCHLHGGPCRRAGGSNPRPNLGAPFSSRPERWCGLIARTPRVAGSRHVHAQRSGCGRTARQRRPQRGAPKSGARRRSRRS